jgi:hypothetical protein
MATQFTITNRKGDEYTCIVDDCDADLLQEQWHTAVNERAYTVYVLRTIHFPKEQKERIHRVIMERVLGRKLERHDHVDHWDRNGLNNQRSNLRLATHGQNMANRRVQKNNLLGVKGVYKIGDRYKATIKINGKLKHLGTFDTAEIAHAAFLAAAKERSGEFACSA